MDAATANAIARRIHAVVRATSASRRPSAQTRRVQLIVTPVPARGHAWRANACAVLAGVEQAVASKYAQKSARPLTGSVSMAIASVLLDGVDLHVRKARALVQSKMVSPAPGVGCAM